MHRFIDSNPKISIHATALVESLRGAIRSLVKLQYETEKTKINQKGDGLNYVAWLSILSFMTQKICALYLGQTDYAFEFEDIKFSLTKRKDTENE